MKISVKTILLLAVSMFPVCVFAHEGHLTAGTIFHLAEHVGVALLVLVAIGVLFVSIKRKREKASK